MAELRPSRNHFTGRKNGKKPRGPDSISSHQVNVCSRLPPPLATRSEASRRPEAAGQILPAGIVHPGPFQDTRTVHRNDGTNPAIRGTLPSHWKQSSEYQLQVSSPGYPTRSDGRILPAETFHPGHFQPLGQYIGTAGRTLPSTAPFQAIRSVHLVTRVAISKAGVSETRVEAPDGTHLNILYPRRQADPGPSHHLPPPTL